MDLKKACYKHYTSKGMDPASGAIVSSFCGLLYLLEKVEVMPEEESNYVLNMMNTVFQHVDGTYFHYQYLV